MTAGVPNTSVSKSRLWAGRLLSGLPLLFLFMDGAVKVVPPKMVVEITSQLGYDPSVLPWLGIVLVVSVILAVIPKTAVLGAILITGYLGGAVATHVRVMGTPFEVVFPVILGVMIWGGMWLRDPGLGRLIPWRRDVNETSRQAS